MDNGKIIDVLIGHLSSVRTLWVINDNMIAYGSFDKIIKIWNINTKQCIKTLEGYICNVTGIIYHSGGNFNILLKWLHD